MIVENVILVSIIHRAVGIVERCIVVAFEERGQAPFPTLR